jgi:Na+-translocating ferredoxin:NAD+ oxidoreductase RnfD subunit
MPTTLPLKKFLRTPKGTLTAIFAVLLAVAGTATGWSAVAPHLLAAIVGACGVELLASSVVTKKLTWPTSALLSGAIVAMILSPATPLVETLWIAGLATGSKYLITKARGHVFNPAALALLVSIPVFATGQSWWGAGGDMPWPFILLVLATGALIVDRINKFPMVLTFAGVYFGGFTLIALIQPSLVTEMFRAPFVQSAVFLGVFMLTDPPTSPGRYIEQIWFGALAAVAACFSQLLGAGQAFLLIGVLMPNAALAGSRIIGSPRPARRTLAQRVAVESTSADVGAGMGRGM